MQVNITKVNRRKSWLQVQCPYLPELPDRFRKIGGKWSAGNMAWEFDVRTESLVRSICIELFGTDGEEEVETCTVLVHLDRVDTNVQNLYGAGRFLASRKERDWTPTVGEGVIVLQGGWDARGGSRKNPSLDPLPGTILQVWDVPVPLATKLVGAHDCYTFPEGEEKPSLETVAALLVRIQDEGDFHSNSLATSALEILRQVQ